MVDVSKNTILKLVADLGNACAIYQDKAFRNLQCKRIECDKIWSFCFAKQKNVRPEFARFLAWLETSPNISSNRFDLSDVR
jgi:hypothetical protein